MKKLITIYVLAVAMVVVYFILSIFFPQEKDIELQHFNTVNEMLETVQDDTEEFKEEETQSQQKFMLLPQK